MSVTCVAWVYSFGHNPQWQDSNLWAKRWAILLITRNITLPNDRFDSGNRDLHIGMPFGWVYEATGNMLRVFTLHTTHSTEALQSKRGGTLIIFIDGQKMQTVGEQYEVQKKFNLLLFNPLRRDFKDFELFVLTYLRVTKKIPLNKG